MSALAEWTISVSSSLTAVSKLAPPTWCSLDEGLAWHLSVSGRPSVAPSISLADSPGPRASLTPSLHQLYTTLPALARGLSVAHARPHECKHTHSSPETFTLDCARKWWPGDAARARHHLDNLDRLWHLLPPVTLSFSSQLPFLPFFSPPSFSSRTSPYSNPPCISSSTPPLSYSLRSMVNSYSTWLLGFNLASLQGWIGQTFIWNRLGALS